MIPKPESALVTVTGPVTVFLKTLGQTTPILSKKTISLKMARDLFEEVATVRELRITFYNKDGSPMEVQPSRGMLAGWCDATESVTKTPDPAPIAPSTTDDPPSSPPPTSIEPKPLPNSETPPVTATEHTEVTEKNTRKSKNQRRNESAEITLDVMRTQLIADGLVEEDAPLDDADVRRMYQELYEQ
jgi:hypothetical protein